MTTQPQSRFALPLMLTAAQWKMPGPVGRPMRLPVGTVFLHHTVSRVTKSPVSDAQHVARTGITRFGRMSYTALIHPHRVIFWGQMNHLGTHTAGHNSTSLGLAMVGNYDEVTPGEAMVYDACVALHVLRSFGLVTERPAIRPHRDVKATACPGARAIAQVLPMLRAVASDPSWRP